MNTTKKIIACIGARDTPVHIQEIMREIGYALASKGRHIRSGGADGADKAFQHGVERYCKENNISAIHYQSIFLPYPNFKGLQVSHQRGIVDFNEEPLNQKAIEIAKEHYIDKKKVKNWPDWMEKLMGRNTFQILGSSLRQPATSVICYTRDGSIDGQQKSSGGTGQALRLALHYNIPVFNLRNEKQLSFITQHLLEDQKIISHDIKIK